MTARTFILRTEQHREALERYLDDYYEGWKVQAGFGHPWQVTVEPEKKKRTNLLNQKMFAVLAQLEPIDWHGVHLNRYEWKDMITGSLKALKVVQNMEGTGFVTCGQSTREMPSKDIWDVIEAAYAIGSQNGIRFIEPHEDLMRPVKNGKS